MSPDEAMIRLIGDLSDDERCRLDHHGYCQTHSWMDTSPCPNARALAVLATAQAVKVAAGGPPPLTPEGNTASRPSIAPLNPPDEFDYCQSLTCSPSIHAASHRLWWLDCGARFERLLCPLAAAPFLEAQADAKAIPSSASPPPPPEGIVARVRQIIASTPVRDGDESLAVVLCQHFADHFDRPESDRAAEEEDEDTGWGPWVIAECEKALTAITSAASEAMPRRATAAPLTPEGTVPPRATPQ